MSRVYDNKPLSALPVENIQLKSAWYPDKYQAGHGVIVEGCVKGRSRHAVVDRDGKRTRYTALHVSARRAHRRRFDLSGIEVEPNFTDTEKVPLINENVIFRVGHTDMWQAMRLSSVWPIDFLYHSQAAATGYSYVGYVKMVHISQSGSNSNI